jgi:hypothetical protein
MRARARLVWPGIEPLEHLADGHLFLDQPAVEHAHHLSLVDIDDKMTVGDISARYIAIAVEGMATKVVPVTCLLQLATTKALAQHGTLIFGDGALDLQQ